MKKKKIVLIQGSFDLLNMGHCLAFKRAKALGDYLIVALNSNKLLKKYKGVEAVLPWEHKKIILDSIQYVDKVVKATQFSPMELLKKYDVDVYVLTREWKSSKTAEIAYMKKKGGKVSFSPRFKGVVSTSQIKEILIQEYMNGHEK